MCISFLCVYGTSFLYFTMAIIFTSICLIIFIIHNYISFLRLYCKSYLYFTMAHHFYLWIIHHFYNFKWHNIFFINIIQTVDHYLGKNIWYKDNGKDRFLKKHQKIKLYKRIWNISKYNLRFQSTHPSLVYVFIVCKKQWTFASSILKGKQRITNGIAKIKETMYSQERYRD